MRHFKRIRGTPTQSSGQKLSVFGRYNQAPSHTITRGLNGTLSQISPTTINTRTITAGATYLIAPAVVTELRGNWSDVRGQEINDLDSFGGAVPIPDSVYYPSTFTGERNFTFSTTSATYQKGGFANNVQKQHNLTDSLSVVFGSHQMKFGVDWRRSTINYRPLAINGQAVFQGATGAITGLISQGSITATAGPKDVSTDNWSLYAQDTWKASSKLTLTYGVRWEMNAYPSEKLGRYPTALIGLSDLATATFAPAGTPLWSASHKNFAPRMGAAYQLSNRRGRETILRGGFGLFYDLPYGSTLGAFSNSWPSAGRNRLPAGTPFPYSTASATPPVLSLTPPATSLIVTDSDFRLPLTYQWNVTLERSLGTMQTISAAYIGAAGRRLIRQEQVINPNPLIVTLNIARNAAESDYNALQLQFTRRLSRGLQVLASYSWSHSLDTASNDATSFAPGSVISPALDHSSSDFDIRHSARAAFTYTPTVKSASGIFSALVNHWALDSILTARSATPVNITTTTDVLGLGINAVSRPDLVAGAPLYISDSTVGGGQRFNRAAFFIPAANSKRQGTLGRNAMRGFSVGQIDLAIRREFRMTERATLQFRGELFNILNHPNFADPDGSLGTNGVPNATFGIATTMLGQSLGLGGVSGGLNPLYQVGGPRSVQLSLKVIF
ncbi:MAG: TonB-dependent receptor [Bryobacteraceae bacterium]